MAEKTVFEVRTERCQTCRYLDTVNNLSICRRYAPAVIFAPIMDQRSQALQFATNSAYAQVNALTGCGEFRPKSAEEN